MSLIFFQRACSASVFRPHIRNARDLFTFSFMLRRDSSLSKQASSVPLAQVCNASLPKALCIEKYAAVMPYHFFRPTSNGTSTPTFRSTSVPNDTSFGLVNQSDFLVFDRERGLDLLGPNPSYDFVFDVSMAVHEAPVYVVAQSKLYLSQVTFPQTHCLNWGPTTSAARPATRLPPLASDRPEPIPSHALRIRLKPTRLRTQRRYIP